MSPITELTQEKKIFNLIEDLLQDNEIASLPETLNSLYMGFIGSEFCSNLKGEERLNIHLDKEVISKFFKDLYNLKVNAWTISNDKNETK
ncbi:hypothetical protein [Dokdonia donghaensis]|uniref:Uncharacterized protein n=1 Tax=Dokdonia donghaensis DSW-1 TaxID=1300343 RepID=A0A0A2GUC4_9FLAO|nr:hypothetical protein [Dokdonia donghaensis]ANH60867.1 hypothetical protein I597_1969 [Dokdonia donghaensis DSW-1]KGO05881.1 hypothetical protein NV36_02810 [Dokdonia donghaensis DSW-1]